MATRSMFFDLHPTCRVKSRREIPNPNLQIPGNSQSPNSKKSKSDARTRAHSESPATAGQNIMASRLHFARSAFGVRCVFASLSSLNINALRRMYLISSPASITIRIYYFVWDLGFTALAVSMAENNLSGSSGCDSLARSRVAPPGNP
jgi:hypothetical protein